MSEQMSGFSRPSRSSREGRMQGIQGWLVVPALCVGLDSLLFGGMLLAMGFEWAFYGFAQSSPPEDEHLTLLAILFMTIELGFSVAGLIGFWFEKRFVPRVMIAYYVVDLAFRLFGPYFGQTPGVATMDGLFFVIWAAIWIPYFVVSERVKATFVN